MPQTLTLNSPRFRTKSINIDLSDPMIYRIIIHREEVIDIEETGGIYSRKVLKPITSFVTFDLAGNPSGDPEILNLLEPIKQAVFDLSTRVDSAPNNPEVPPV